jgi:hypothetical protein
MEIGTVDWPNTRVWIWICLKIRNPPPMDYHHLPNSNSCFGICLIFQTHPNRPFSEENLLIPSDSVNIVAFNFGDKASN